jgi:hypothetical protein
VDVASVNRARLIVSTALFTSFAVAIVGAPDRAESAPAASLSVDTAPAPLDAPRPLDDSIGLRAAGRLDRREDADVGHAIDLFGNDVTLAVAKYKVDNLGSIYELHSPHTEVPRLGIPKS